MRGLWHAGRRPMDGGQPIRLGFGLVIEPAEGDRGNHLVATISPPKGRRWIPCQERGHTPHPPSCCHESLLLPGPRRTSAVVSKATASWRGCLVAMALSCHAV